MPTALPSIPFAEQQLYIQEYKTIWPPFGGTPVTQDFNAGKSDRWMGTITTTILSPAQVRALRAWMATVGVYGEIYVPDLDHDPQVASDGLVKGGSQTGNSLTTDGWGASVTVAKAGSVFLIDDIPQLCVLKSDVTSDGLGNATFTFDPILKASPADNSQITVVDPKMTARLLTQIEIKTDKRGLGLPVTFAFEEVV